MRWMAAALALLAISPLLRAAGQPDPATTPEAADHLFYDRSLNRLVMLVESRRTGRMQVWGDENGRWTLINGEGPPARELGGAAYDVHRRVIVMHGGMRLVPSERGMSDTWEWDGKTWRQRAGDAGPRDHHAMAYDEARRRTVLVGGQSAADALSTDTWEWDGERWTRIDASVPGGRAHFALAYDSVRKQVVLFGGIDQKYGVHGDTWGWDGKTWQKVADDGPTPRSHHRMASDPAAGRIVLFGGLDRGTPSKALDDTWVWDGTSWSSSTEKGPPRRSGQLMTHDAGRRQIVLARGGSWDGKASTRYDDLWTWANRWIQVR